MYANGWSTIYKHIDGWVNVAERPCQTRSPDRRWLSVSRKSRVREGVSEPLAGGQARGLPLIRHAGAEPAASGSAPRKCRWAASMTRSPGGLGWGAYTGRGAAPLAAAAAAAGGHRCSRRHRVVQQRRPSGRLVPLHTRPHRAPDRSPFRHPDRHQRPHHAVD